MPVGSDSDFATSRRKVIRRITAVRGRMNVHMECRPAFNYARDGHETVMLDGGTEFHSAHAHLGLSTSVPLTVENNGDVADFSLDEGETATFVLRELTETGTRGLVLSEADAEAAFRETVVYWRDWLSQSTYRGRWREMVDRSALALKLLTYEPTGAIAAAPTCGLPEGIGGERNWDYRYTWLPIYLAPGFRVHRVRPAPARFHEGSRCLREVHPGRVRRSEPRRIVADHVRHRRPQGSHGGDPRSARRVHGITARAHRQRRR
jgi:GH15 family glucan-1,4-alpha-glucosidase